MEIMLQNIGFERSITPLVKDKAEEESCRTNKEELINLYPCTPPLVKALDAHIWQNGTKEEAVKVERLVKGYVSAIIDDLCCLGRYKKGLQLIESGSFYEGLRVGLPYEFDFMLEIQEEIEFTPLDNELRTVIQSDIQEKLISDLQQCFRRRKGHKELKLREFRDRYNCPNFWFYMQYRNVGVMIDLVPCLKLAPGKLPLPFDEDAVRFIRNVVPAWGTDTASCISSSLFLVPTEIHRYWRVSTSQVELEVMQNLPLAAKRYLRIMKYLCNRRLMHDQAYDSRRIGKAEMFKLFGYSSFLPSYILKLFFLHHMKKVYVNKLPLCQGMYSADSLGILQAIMKQLKQFKTKYIANQFTQTVYLNSVLFGSNHQIKFQCFAMLDQSEICKHIEWFDQMTNGIELFLDENWQGEDISDKVRKLNLLNYPKDKGVTFP